jgi:hypothetical protein
LRILIHYLIRLLVARNTNELLPDQQLVAELRIDFLWGQLHLVLRDRFRMNNAQAVTLVEKLAAEMLQRECCRRAVWRTVPLAEALGPYV